MPVWLLPMNIRVNACMVPESHWLSRGLRTQPSALRRPAVLWRNLRALPRHTTRATSQMLFGKPCLHLLGAFFFGKQAAARGICVLRPRCACGAVGVRASLAPLSGRAAGIEWPQSGDSLSQPVAATAKAWCLWQRKLAKGITCHAPSQGSFASTFFQRWKEGFMLFEVEVAFIVQPGLVPKRFL